MTIKYDQKRALRASGGYWREWGGWYIAIISYILNGLNDGLYNAYGFPLWVNTLVSIAIFTGGCLWYLKWIEKTRGLAAAAAVYQIKTLIEENQENEDGEEKAKEDKVSEA